MFLHSFINNYAKLQVQPAIHLTDLTCLNMNELFFYFNHSLHHISLFILHLTNFFVVKNKPFIAKTSPVDVSR